MKIEKFLDYAFIVLLLLSSLFATKALWYSGLFTSHDGPHQVVRLYYYQKALEDGQFPPRYVSSALQGFGYPLFVFSYHLPWLVAAPLRFLGISIYDCLKILFAFSFSLSALTMFFFQKRLWGKWGAFVGAFLYLWAPFRFEDIFVRGALGENFCYIFLPLVFYGLTSFNSDKKAPSRIKNLKFKIENWWIIGSLGIAGLILSHALIFLLVLPAIFLYWVLELVNNFLSLPAAQATKKSPRNSECRIASARQLASLAMTSLKTFLLGFGLSAFYLLPAFFLKKYAIFNQLMAGRTASFTDHFPTFRQLLYSPWGYGFSFPGVEMDQMSFQVGVAQWLVVGMAIIIVLYVIAKGPARCGMTKQSQRKRLPRSLRSLAMTKSLFINKEKIYPATIFFLFIFFFSIFMMLPISTPVWRLVNCFAYIDYPWRYLLLSVFSASILGGFVVWASRNNKILIIGLLVLALYANRNHLRANKYLDWPPEAFVGEGDTSNTFDEYTPKWADRAYVKEKRPLVEVLQGEGDWQLLAKKTNKVELAVENEKESLYRLNLLYFPDVRLLVDGRPIGYDYKGKGVLDFSLPKGDYKIEVFFVRTRLEKIAIVISLFSSFVLILLLLANKPKQFFPGKK